MIIYLQLTTRQLNVTETFNCKSSWCSSTTDFYFSCLILVLTSVSLGSYKQFHNPSVKQHDILIELVIHNNSNIRHHRRKRLNSLRLQYATFHLEATKCIVSPLFVPSGVQLRPALVTQFDGLLRGHSAWGSGNIKPLWTLKTWTEEVNLKKKRKLRKRGGNMVISNGCTCYKRPKGSKTSSFSQKDSS